MPTVSLNERGVVVRGCDSSTPSIRMSRSRASFADGSGADIGVNAEEYACVRLVSPVADPNTDGDAVSLGSLCVFSNSNGEGLLRFFLLDVDSVPAPSGACVESCGVVVVVGIVGAMVEGGADELAPRGDGAWGACPGGNCPGGSCPGGDCPDDSSGAVRDDFAFLGGGYTSPRAIAASALACASALVGLPRFFGLACSPTCGIVYAGPGTYSPG